MKNFEFNEEALTKFVKENAKFTCLKTGVELDVIKSKEENPGGNISIVGGKRAANMLVTGDDGTVQLVLVIWTEEKGYCEATPFTAEEKRKFSASASYSDEGDCDCPACQLDRALKEEGILPAEENEGNTNSITQLLSFLQKTKRKTSLVSSEITYYKESEEKWKEYLSQELLGIEYPNGDREIMSQSIFAKNNINLAKTVDKEKAMAIFKDTGDISAARDIAKMVSISVEDYIESLSEKAKLKYFVFSGISEQLDWFHKY